MNVEVVFEPKTPPMSWQDFKKNKPPFSIAGDGYVEHPPAYNLSGLHAPQANFDHHTGVNRTATSSTCKQMYDAIQGGLFERFRDQDGPKATLYFNDNDQDVCTTGFQAENYQSFGPSPALKRLVNYEDTMDRKAGMVNDLHKDAEIHRQIAWIFEPYSDFRFSGGLDRKNPSEYRTVYEDVSSRIKSHLMGSGDEIPINLDYEVMRPEKGWSMVQEKGAQARMAMMSDGIKAFVSVRPRLDGKFNYIIGKIHEIYPFPLDRILKELKKAEGDANDQWGGNPNFIIGSPRIGGSKLSPDEIAKIINDCVAKNKLK